jgi:hypothetical protein
MLPRNGFRRGLNLKFTLGTITAGAVIGLSSLSIVRAEHVSPAQVYTCSSGTACVEGNSTGNNATYGVYGEAANADGVHGVTASTKGNSGVTGIATGTSGSAHGVYGRSQNGDGVFGTTAAASGTNLAGVYGTGSIGVYGISSNVGVVGTATGGGGIGISAVAKGLGTALSVTGDGAGDLFIAENVANGGGLCEIDYEGNLACSGTISGSSVLTRQRSNAGHRVLAYPSESSTATIEDVGTARLFNGIANVVIPTDFASTIDRGSEYYVFLTPQGDTRGLYVSTKMPGAFQVRENGRGRANVAFDYRIVAHPLGASNDRLPIAPRFRPRLMQPAH